MRREHESDMSMWIVPIQRRAVWIGERVIVDIARNTVMLGELRRPELPHNIPKRKRLVLVRWSLSRQLSIDAANVLLTDIAAMDPSSLEDITIP